MYIVTDVLIEDDRWQKVELAALAERSVICALTHFGMETQGYEVAILACDDTRIATLNAEFRDKPTPTNVLSWPAFDLAADTDGGAPAPPPDPDPLMAEALGDIAISYETCAREAAELSKTMDQHVTHLIVHGLLHLLGYDHIRDHDATLMERCEMDILGKLGLPDPYMLDDGPLGPTLE